MGSSCSKGSSGDAKKSGGSGDGAATAGDGVVLRDRQLPPVTIGPNKTRPPPRVYVARHDFQALQSDHLSFKDGDHFVIRTEDPSSLVGKWCQAQAAKDLVAGLVPFDYFRPLEDVENQPWYFGKTSHSAAEKMLQLGGVRIGYYLIRRRRADADWSHIEFALSVKTGDNPTVIQHYLIQQLDNGHYFLEKKQAFESLAKLVEFYSRHNRNMITKPISGKQRLPRLTLPCPKIQPNSDPDSWAPLQEVFQLPRDKLVTIEPIGEQGRFCETYFGRYDGSQDLAIKLFSSDFLKRDIFVEETQKLVALKHRRLIACLGVCHDTYEPTLLVLELSRSGTLVRHLQRKYEGNRSIPVADVIDLAEQICEGMEYLELKGIVHGDLALRNILMEKNNIKIGDAGLFRIISDEVYAQCRSMLRWTAPEGMTGSGLKVASLLSTKTDVWAFGIVITEIITKGRVPYEGKTDADVLHFVKSGRIMPRLPDCPQQLYDLLTQCWKWDPDERRTFAALKWDFEAFFVDGRTAYKDVSQMGHDSGSRRR